MKKDDIYGLSVDVLSEIIQLAKDCNITQLRIFGSRARGDFNRTSDIDLAVWGGNQIQFRFDIEEEIATLLKFDVVNMDVGVSEDLQCNIEKEGIVIYEKAGKL